MKDTTIDTCTDADRRIILDDLTAYNHECVPYTQSEPFRYPEFKAMVDGEMAGGILGKQYCWGCLYIDVLFVKAHFRGRGIGTGLLHHMHRYAAENGCSLIHLDTFDFQALGFYLNHGYRVFGTLHDCPPGHSRYFMAKHLYGSGERASSNL